MKHTSVVLLGLLLASCSSAPVNPVDPGHAARLLEIARDYRRYGRVDDLARWAPQLCEMPKPSVARFSASADPSTHGRKLYFLFAKDRRAYMVDRERGDQPVGQVLVKESWIPEELRDGSAGIDPEGRVDSGEEDPGVRNGRWLPYAERDGRRYHASTMAALFIMFKQDPASAGSDRGWIYGTVSADGKSVTSAGRVSSCMKCHEEAPRDRMFGLP